MSNQWKWKTPIIRFWEKVDKSPQLGTNGDCWEWRGGKRGSRKSSQSATHYGGIRFGGYVQLAHRVSFILAYGNIPESVNVLHRCDNPACVNPEHLWLGDSISNVRDAWTKGRGRVPVNRTRGSKRPQAKLDEEKVATIRRQMLEGYNDACLAGLYKVTAPTIRAIRVGRTWKHVKEALDARPA